MSIDQIIKDYINPGLDLLPDDMSSKEAMVMIIAIGLQESLLKHTKQIGGPAVSWWQMEKGGGIKGVLRHPASANHADDVCRMRGVAALPDAVYAALEHDQILGSAFARLLLWTDPKPLPDVGEVEQAWNLYLRVWRPGAAKRQYDQLRAKWSVNYVQAMEAIS